MVERSTISHLLFGWADRQWPEEVQQHGHQHQAIQQAKGHHRKEDGEKVLADEAVLREGEH